MTKSDDEAPFRRFISFRISSFVILSDFGFRHLDLVIGHFPPILTRMNLFPHCKWIFFDVGYTLLDETPAWQAMFKSLSADAARDGLPVSTDVIWQTFRQVALDFEPKQWWALCKRLSPNEEEARRLEHT